MDTEGRVAGEVTDAGVFAPRSRTLRDEQGTSAVEFAIVLSLLVILLFGIVQFALAFHRWQGLQAAAREGARVASVGATEEQVGDRVRAAQSLFQPTSVKVKIDYSRDDGDSWVSICDDDGPSTCATDDDPPCRTAGQGTLVRVRAHVPGSEGYNVQIPLVGDMEIDYDADGTFRCEKTG